MPNTAQKPRDDSLCHLSTSTSNGLTTASYIDLSGEPDDDDVDDDEFEYPIKYNCNQIRTKINNWINGGNEKVTHFQRRLNINSNSYGRFMALKGPWSGMDNQTFHAAHQFFCAREAQGLKIPAPKKASTVEAQKWNADTMPKLDDEDAGEVRVFDTCADMRTKIRAHLRQPGVTQAGFAREISKCTGRNGSSIQAVQVASFLKKKDVMAGNTSGAFYASYVYFEKMRLRDRKPKSKKRQEMEVRWTGQGGVDTRHVSENQHYIGSASLPPPTINQYGQVGRFSL